MVKFDHHGTQLCANIFASTTYLFNDKVVT